MSVEGKVAIITGAGGGLGKEHAMLLSSHGAKVVVSDLNGGVDGAGQSDAADLVVEEIKDNGGQLDNVDEILDLSDAVPKTIFWQD